MTRYINRCCLAGIRAAMAQPHPVKPANAPAFGWGVAPQIIMSKPNDAALPSWWKGPRDFGGAWKAVVAWFTVHEQEGGNPSPLAGVEVSDLELWGKKISGEWALLQAGVPEWCGTFAATGGTWNGAQLPITTQPDGSVIVTPKGGAMMHGARFRVPLPFAGAVPDVISIYATVTHRAVGAGASASRFVVQCGVDWWPTMEAQTSAFSPCDYNPGAASGPFVKSETTQVHSHVYA